MTTPQSRPIPPLYTVYILRSTVRHSSLYIGSTPNPPRRLKQHNGFSKGGAARTSRSTLRPWEMVGLVSGFPGMVTALKFEWALTNPHISLHIPSSSRITISSQTKRSGHPKRPRPTLTSVLSNLHLLLRVPSFSRLPLALHFFDRDVHGAWSRWCATANEPIRATIPVLTDFDLAEASTAASRGNGSGSTATTTTKKRGTKSASSAAVAIEESEEAQKTNQHPATSEAEGQEALECESGEKPWGIHALPLDYAPMRDYVAKTEAIFTFERAGPCLVCREPLQPGEGLYVVCPNTGCEGAGHATCWSRHLLRGSHNDNNNGNDHDDAILPISGQCLKCHGPVRWGDMMRELTLRSRGQKEFQKLLKKPRKKRAVGAKTTAAAATKAKETKETTPKKTATTKRARKTKVDLDFDSDV